MPDAGRKPNIILILTDHFRPDALSRGATPNLMALAARGTRFERCYSAAPLCQPARNCIITGKYPSQHGVCGNQSPPIAQTERVDTFMHHLQRAGYYTALVGKHHYIDRYGIGMDVTDDDETIRGYGFDSVFQVVDDGENQHNDDRYTRYLEEKGTLEEFRAGFAEHTRAFRHPFDEDDSADGFIGVNGVRFVSDYEPADHDGKPFYLNLSFVGPHPPYWHPGEPTVHPDDTAPPVGVPESETAWFERVRTVRAHYQEKCRLIDRYVGRLVDALSARGILEDTAIIFTSDHGDNLGDFGIFDKRYFYEQSCGVPLIMAGPGVPSGERLNGPRVSKALCSHVDLYPTMLQLAGSPEHASVANSRERVGMSLIDAVDGGPGSRHREIHAELGTLVMVRTGGWKLVYDPEQGGVTDLYNLRRDPSELDNLAGAAGYDGIVRALVESILSHRIRMTQFTHAKEEQRLQSIRTG